MPIVTYAKSEEFHSGAFKPHGTMQLNRSGPLNILEAVGPFNLELVIAADRAQGQLYAALVEYERWGTILIFKKNALTSLEAIAEITSILVKRKKQGYVPVAVALVFSADVEGANLMKSHYLNAYLRAGIQGRIFDNEYKAMEWISGEIGY